MKITLTNKEAKTLFCQKAAPDRTGIIFEALNGQARTMTINRATGTALETKINTSRIAEKGTAILPDVTSEIVALAPDKDMTIETNEDKASITFEGGAYTLPTMLKPQDKDPLETIPAEEMEYGLIQGPFFARTLTGAMRIITSVPDNAGPTSFALIDVLPGRADFVATNKKLLACWSVKDDTGTNHITGTGRIIIAIGSNENAVRLSGISVTSYKIIAYLISGFTAGLAGIIITSRVSTGSPITGDGYELDAIASCVIGGASLSGGVGTVVNTVIGVLVLQLLSNTLNLLSVPSYPQQIIKGIVMIIAVLAQRQKTSS